MLPKSNKLSLDKDFDRAFKLGQSFYSKILGVKVINNGLEINRFGILVSTKVSKKAVRRNLIKRQIRAILKEEIETMKTGKDVVVITLPVIVDKDFEEIKNSLKNCFIGLKLYV